MDGNMIYFLFNGIVQPDNVIIKSLAIENIILL